MASYWESEVQEETRRLIAPCQDEACEAELGYPMWPSEMTLGARIGIESSFTA